MQVAIDMAEKRAGMHPRRDSGGDEAARDPGNLEAGGPDADAQVEGGPLRRCLATRAVRPKTELLRFVIGPEGALVPDLAGRLPGRGLWVSAERAALIQAREKNLFAKAAKAPVRVPDTLVEDVIRLLRRRCLELIGLARGAGQAVAGFEKVREWLNQDRAAVLLEALDGAPDGRRRLESRAKAEGALPVIDLFTAAELAAALGRDHVVHAALAEGGLARAVLTEAGRLAGLLPGHEN